MEWEAPALVLSATPYGENAVVAHVLTAEHGAYRGLVRGGASRKQASLWQAGNLVSARWFARLPEQLGNLGAELVHPSAARIMLHRLPLALLSSCCAVADGALPEREPHPRVFDGLVKLLTLLSLDAEEAQRSGVVALIRWEAALLADLGYGLDLTSCAVTGEAGELSFVSPRSGRGVSAVGAGTWRDRLLPLPPFIMNAGDVGNPSTWSQGLRLTGHFLARDAFGARHQPLPAARSRLQDMIEAMPVAGEAPG
ncbi:DNA repair protein RecO [Lichenicoccus roseus]|uniref:DNA repair protein RecO n=1 Tax=Lichenicoccus roseus TaxID=2683649 RepID=A0A5R9J847_9PROT|nr:DNA repair protein RecO [Lichenicoccus roseus]TLU72697.1 DNA repair protein RecO [Lichenicoccus roseus]